MNKADEARELVFQAIKEEEITEGLVVRLQLLKGDRNEIGEAGSIFRKYKRCLEDVKEVSLAKIRCVEVCVFTSHSRFDPPEGNIYGNFYQREIAALLINDGFTVKDRRKNWDTMTRYLLDIFW